MKDRLLVQRRLRAAWELTDRQNVDTGVKAFCLGTDRQTGGTGES